MVLERGSFLSRDAMYTFLQVCNKEGDLAGARQAHSLMIMADLHRLAALGDHLIRLFAACGGTTLESSLVFCTVSQPTSYTWQAIIFAHATMDQHERALQLYINMQEEGFTPCGFVLSSTLRACGNVSSIYHGRSIHNHIVAFGFESKLVLGSSLVDMYGKCGHLIEAQAVFDAMPLKNAVAWSAMMAAYVHLGWGFHAIELFKAMQEACVKPDDVSFLSALKACSCIGNILVGRLIHHQIVMEAFSLNGAIGNTLVDMYAKCESLEEASNTFKRLPARTLVSYGAILAGYAQHAHWVSAMKVFKDLLQEGIKPNEVIFLSLVKACSTRGALDMGRLIHVQIVENELESGILVGSALIHMYGKCGNPKDAFNVFVTLPGRDAVSWEVLMSGFLGQGLGINALDFFKEMQGEGIKQDGIIFLSGLKTCGRLKAMEEGRLIHNQVVENSFETDKMLGNALLDMYLRCESFEDALEVHGKLLSKDIVTWNTLIAGCMHYGELSAFEIFSSMQQDCVTPDMVTFTILLRRYGTKGALEQGKQVHEQLLRCGCELDLVIGTALVFMYARCGYVDDAHKILEGMQYQDVVSWNALIAGYIQQGNYSLAMQCLKNLQKQGLQPNASTCTSILAICSHVGALEEGYQFLTFMQDHGMIPQIEHINSMIDLLGRSGCLFEAKKLVATLPGVADNVGWRSLLTSCRTYGNFKLGKQCLDQLAALSQESATACALTCNM